MGYKNTVWKHGSKTYLYIPSSDYLKMYLQANDSGGTFDYYFRLALGIIALIILLAHGHYLPAAFACLAGGVRVAYLHWAFPHIYLYKNKVVSFSDSIMRLMALATLSILLCMYGIPVYYIITQTQQMGFFSALIVALLYYLIQDLVACIFARDVILLSQIGLTEKPFEKHGFHVFETFEQFSRRMALLGAERIEDSVQYEAEIQLVSFQWQIKKLTNDLFK